jgi:YidC/Oxa1 family membrane protein insertase
MEKRLFLAILLSLSVLLTWSYFAPKPASAPLPLQPVATEPITALESPKQITSLESPKEAAVLPILSEFGHFYGKSEAIFVEPQAAIKEVIAGNYQSYKFYLKYGLLVGDKAWVFNRQPIVNNEVTYLYQDAEKNISKRLIFSNSHNDMILELKIRNISTSPLVFKFPLYLGVLDFAPTKKSISYQDVTVAGLDKTEYPNIRKESSFNQMKFMGLRDRYFCVIVEPLAQNYSGFIKKVSANESEVGLLSPEFKLAAGEELEQKFHIYLGPQELKTIKAIKPEWQAVIYYGKFDFIAQILLQLLEALFKLVHNWGWAIIVLSLIIYIVLFPLTLKQMKSMKEMQHIQPQVEQLRVLYKDNPQRLNKEIMELYRQHKVNPLGGCLPMVLQIPIFFALYQVLSRSIALKGADFLWIKDLSEPDRLLKFPVELPLVGQYFNLLPVLMAIGMFIQQKSSMGKMSGSSAEQQKMMLIVMPIMFGFIFYNMPAGLVLYWFVNSALASVYQLRLAKAK